MFRQIEMPLWLLILILAFAAVTFASHFLFPSVRWFFRRRMERVVARLNERLERPIEPFKLLRRHDMIQRLSYDPKVIEAVSEHATEHNQREDVSFQQAQSYAREIVPSFSASVYFGFAVWFTRLISRAFYRVRLEHVDEAALGAIDPDATVIFVMNHRSNMDYVLVTYLAAERSALAFAAGEWARVWPLSRLIKSMGAYFIRRRSRDALYRRVLARYVQIATKNGLTQAVFPEGGLSLNGRVGEPKLGLLNYIVTDFDIADGRDVVFVPVALNYDRVLEDRVLIKAGQQGTRKFRFRWWSAVRYFCKHLFERLTGRFLRFGYAAVSFGAPVSLAAFSDGKEGDITRAIGQRLMQNIREIVPLLPIPLVAGVLVGTSGPLSRAAVADAVIARIAQLPTPASHSALINGNARDEINVALNHLLMRRIIHESDAGIEMIASEIPLLEFYSNSIAHLVGKNPA